MFIANFDGGIRKDEGITYGFIIKENDVIIHEEGDVIPIKSSSNVAEYMALIICLSKCIDLGIKELEVYGDSSLIVNQSAGIFQVKDERMKILNSIVKQLSKRFTSITFTWNGRNTPDQKRCDRLGR